MLSFRGPPLGEERIYAPIIFDKYKKKQKGSRVRLCGIDKKNIWGAMYLHKLSEKSKKTVAD